MSAASTIQTAKNVAHLVRYHCSHAPAFRQCPFQNVTLLRALELREIPAQIVTGWAGMRKIDSYPWMWVEINDQNIVNCENINANKIDIVSSFDFLQNFAQKNNIDICSHIDIQKGYFFVFFVCFGFIVLCFVFCSLFFWCFSVLRNFATFFFGLRAIAFFQS